jgi:large subunit ribosomal protein L4
MEAKLYNQAGTQIGTIQISDEVFGISPNKPVMHQAMVRQMANARYGTHNTLNRGEVRGSTRKLYRQKGTGRARQGSARAPHRMGGGVAHGPHPRSYAKDMPRKMRRLAVRSALSAKQATEQIRFVDALAFERPRTKDMIAMLEAQQLSGKTLIVLDEKNQNVSLSASNLPNVKVLLANYLNVVDLLSHDNVIMPVSAVTLAQGYLAQGDDGAEVVVQQTEGKAPMPAAEPPALQQPAASGAGSATGRAAPAAAEEQPGSVEEAEQPAPHSRPMSRPPAAAGEKPAAPTAEKEPAEPAAPAAAEKPATPTADEPPKPQGEQKRGEATTERDEEAK